MSALSPDRADLRLPFEEFRLIRDLVNAASGICFGDEALYLVERRLRDRVTALGLQSFAEYYQYLRYNPGARAELEEAIETLTLNETYFFREDYQLRAFQKEILPELRERADGRGSLAVWSAGCSTGEEVYTIAMLILETGLFEGWDVKVFGNDINRRVLHHARRGVYGRGAFRVTPESYRKAFFVERDDGMHVIDRVRSMCHFGHLNLIEDDRIALIGRVDAVFCRNVLIYFDTAARRKVIENLYGRLNPGGYLLLGHSESLINLSTSFEIVHLKEDLVYRRPRGSAVPLDRDQSP